LDHENQNENLVGVMMPFDAGFSGVYTAIKKAAALITVAALKDLDAGYLGKIERSSSED
jgi:hypothetical protein